MEYILLIEDSEDIQLIVNQTLGRQYDVTTVRSAEEAISLLQTRDFNLILLDLTLPKKDGHSFLSEMQHHPRAEQTPVICLTSRSLIADKVAAFSLGAEDYILKPFDVTELRARVDAKLRKTRKQRDTSNVIQIENLEINRDRHEAAWVSGLTRTALGLTPTEFKLLLHLARSPGQVFSREQLLVAVWGNDSEVYDRTVDVHLHSLRKKMGASASWIQAVSGVGYSLRVMPAAAKKAA